MGLMDKVKAQATVLVDKAQTGVQQGQTKLAEMQSGKQADHLLRELGAYVFLSERNRAQPDSEAKVAKIMGELDALEAAGTPVTITPDAPDLPAAGAVPQSVAPDMPLANSAPPPPPAGSAPPPPPVPTSGSVPPPPVPTGGSGPPPGNTGSAIPRSGGGLPGE
jgi:hypothetical protein